MGCVHGHAAAVHGRGLHHRDCGGSLRQVPEIRSQTVQQDRLARSGKEMRLPAAGSGGTAVYVQNCTINDDGNLIVTLSDGSTINAGKAKGDTGAAGAKGDKGNTGDTVPAGEYYLVWSGTSDNSSPKINDITIM